MPDPALIGGEEAPRTYLRERALVLVTNNLAPAPFLLLPFVLLVSGLLRSELPSERVGWWAIAARLVASIQSLRWRISPPAAMTRGFSSVRGMVRNQ